MSIKSTVANKSPSAVGNNFDRKTKYSTALQSSANNVVLSLLKREVD